MDLELKCDLVEFENVRFSRRGTRGLVVAVKRSNEDSNILLSYNDAERLYEYIGEYLGKDKESVPEKPSLNVEEASSELQHDFYCATDDGSHLATGYDQSDNQLTLELTEDYHTTYIYLKAEDAMKLSESITKVFGTEHTKSEPNYMRPLKAVAVVDEFEAASKADLKALEERYLLSLESIAEERSEIVSSIDRDYADLEELKEDFHNNMGSVIEDWSKLNKDLNQVHVEISQIQNDIFNTNESTKVKLESLGKHIECVSKEVVAAMEHLATRIDENGEEIQSLKVQEDIRKMKSRSVW